MRGSSLIFNSLDELDPEILDKIDDLSSLDSFNLDDGFLDQETDHKSENSYNSEHVQIRNYYSQETTTTESSSFQSGNNNAFPTANAQNDEHLTKLKFEAMNSNLLSNHQNRRNHGIRTSNSHKAQNAIETTAKNNNLRYSVPKIKSSQIILMDDECLSSSPPLNKSNYFQSGGAELSHHHNHANSQYLIPSKGKLTQPQVVVMKEKTTLTSGMNGAGLPLSRLSIGSSDKVSNSLIKEVVSHSVNPCNENSKSFSRFLFNLDFTRSNKEDKNRFNVNNLSPQLREEIKRIYVY